ncbi:MAG: plastocyanin/azurin family copper-binding protein [Terriglobales bacterium]
MRHLGQIACWIATVAMLATGATAGTVEGHVQVNDTKLDKSDFVVYLDDLEGPLPAPGAVATMDQRGLRFVPHVLVIQAGTTVDFPNSDPLAHNVFSISPAKRFNLGLYGRGTVRQMKFDQPGVVQLLCNVHQEMSAFIVVVKNPYFARPHDDGSFRIAGVPAGKHRLRCWHERLGERVWVVNVPANGAVSQNLAME